VVARRRWLAFAASSDGGSALYVIRADGADRRLVVNGASAPAWSPSGESIAYRAPCGGVKLVTPAGEDVTPGTPVRALPRHRPCRKPGLVARRDEDRGRGHDEVRHGRAGPGHVRDERGRH
jgi:hypothetical protein